MRQDQTSRPIFFASAPVHRCLAPRALDIAETANDGAVADRYRTEARYHLAQAEAQENEASLILR